MKRNIRKLLSIILCVIMTVSAFGVLTIGASAEGAVTIYVSDSGDDANPGTSLDKPVKTLAAAAKLAGNSGTVIVADSTSVAPAEHIPGCTIKGLNSNSVINLTGWAMRFSGPVTIENITLNAKEKWSYILAQGHKLVIGDDVTVTADPGVTTALSIRGGGDNMEIGGSCEVIVKSGVWKTVSGGTRNKDVAGNTHITIYDNATVSSVNLGNEGEGIVRGSSTVKIIGKMNPIPGNITGKADANRYIDLTEYSGVIPESWYNSGATIIKDATKVPVDAKPVSKGGEVGVSGKTYDTGVVEKPAEETATIYISDNGNDSNDGKTITTAVKTMGRANALLGKGGTLIIADKHTYTGEVVKAAKIEGFMPDCVMDVTVWKINIGANCEMDNFVLHTNVNWSFLICNGYSFTAGENLKTAKTAPATVNISIRGGGEKFSVSGDTNVVLKGGTWHNVFCGTKGGNVSGNGNVTVYPGAVASSVSFGNDAAAANEFIGGRSVLKLVGDSTQVKAISPSPIARGGCFIDVSEYTGKLPDSWELGGVSLIKAGGAEVPAFVAPVVVPPTTGKITTIVPGAGVVYVSENGSNMNDGKTPEKPVKNIETALNIGGANPTIVVVDSVTGPSGAFAACKIVGYSSKSVYKIPTWALRLGGNTSFENITIMPLVKFSYILAQGNNLTIGKDVTVEKGPDVTTELGIRGGGEGSSLNKDSDVEIMSGSWGDIHGGTRNASINGNTFVTIHEGATANSVNIGNNGVKEGNTFNGNGVIKLVGNPAIKSITAKPDYQEGEMVLDLTEFTGEQDASWNKLGATVVKDAEQLPEYITGHFASGEGGYDLSEITKFRFISDKGDDANDGLTKDKPMKSIKAAVNAMGAGGTVIVTGQYTLNEYTSGLPSFNITSSCNTDNFVMGLWALHTNNTKIYNVNIIIPKDYYFILHGGKPLHIGQNVTTVLSNGAKVYLGIRGNESGDIAMTDVTIESGDWAAIFTGTKNGNVLGNSTITMTGGTTTGITAGNDSATGRILGNTRIILKDKPLVNIINDKSMSAGYIIVDVSEFTGIKPTIPMTFTVVTDKNAIVVPINKTALFINGYPDGTFLPEKVMTRAEAITVAAKVAGITASYVAPETTAFKDLKAEDWYATNVKYIESFGTLEFWGDTLDANKGITRGEFVKLISGMIEKVDGEAISFSDVTESHPFFNEIALSARAGLVTGYPDGTFLPDNTLKRSEIVTILNRLTKRFIVDSNTAKINKFSDIAGHWAAPQVIAASCEATTDGIILWYVGDKIAENSPVDKSLIELTTTKAVLEGVDVNDADAVAAAVEAYAVKRRSEIASTETAVTVSGTKYYVSSVSGSDEADGKTPESAWKSLEKVNKAKLSEGDGVFFKRGEIFRGQLTTQKGVTYSAYGEGEKPALYGSERNYANSGFWVPTGKTNVYVSSETFANDVGLIVFDEGKEVGLKEALGLKSFLGAVTQDLQFFHDKNDNKIYLYSVSDPNTRWNSIEIAQGRHGVAGDGNNVTLDNLCIKYSGAHGVGYGNNTSGLTVQNCEIGWIGGMIQGSDSRIVRYGNGVEIYVGCKDYTITNCHIYQVYDAGITHQYFQTKEDRVDMENIKYTDNVIEYCTYDIEYVNAQPAEKGIMRNVEISGNLLLHGAEGWGQQRGDSTPAVIKGWSNVNNAENAVYSDNVLMTTSNKCVLIHLGVGSYSYMPELYGNLFVGIRGRKLGLYGLMTDNTWIEYNEKLFDTTVGLDDNTMIFLEQ